MLLGKRERRSILPPCALAPIMKSESYDSVKSGSTDLMGHLFRMRVGVKCAVGEEREGACICIGVGVPFTCRCCQA